MDDVDSFAHVPGDDVGHVLLEFVAASVQLPCTRERRLRTTATNI